VGITDWKGEVPPEPNYAEPVTLLAAKCIKHFDWQECQFSMLWTATETLLATLGITIEDRIMAALLKLRRAGSAHDEFMRLALADEHAYQSNILLPRAGWVDVTESSLLQRLDTGQLILTWSDQHQENRLQGAEWHDLYDRWRRVVNASRPKMGVQELLARNHITIGLACSEARSGDTVVALPITPPGSIRRCLILRPGDAQTCEIVGQAIVNGVYIPAYGSVSFHERLRDALSDTNTRRIDSIEDITFNFYFSEVDWLLLVAQGASVETLSDPSPKNGTMDLELGRLERSVTHAPLSSYVTRVQDSRKRRELRRMQFGTSGRLLSIHSILARLKGWWTCNSDGKMTK